MDGSCRSESSGTILCITEKDFVSKITEVTHAKANSFQSLRFVVTAFNKAICPGNIHRVNNLVKPVVVSLGAIMELRKIHNLDSPKPVEQAFLALSRGFGANHPAICKIGLLISCEINKKSEPIPNRE